MHKCPRIAPNSNSIRIVVSYMIEMAQETAFTGLAPVRAR